MVGDSSDAIRCLKHPSTSLRSASPAQPQWRLRSTMVLTLHAYRCIRTLAARLPIFLPAWCICADTMKRLTTFIANAICHARAPPAPKRVDAIAIPVPQMRERADAMHARGLQSLLGE